MIIRQATLNDLQALQWWLEESGGETFDLRESACFVAEEDGQILGMLPLRPMWQAEPLLVRGAAKMQNSRAALLLYREAENFIRATPGPKWIYAVTRSKHVKGWAARLGWFRQYKGAALFIKYLGR